MDWNTPDLNSWPAKLVIRVGKKLRSDKKFTQEAIEKNNAREAERRRHRQEQHALKNGYTFRGSMDSRHSHPQNDVNELGERDWSVFSEASTLVDQPAVDYTDMMHRLAHHDSFDSLVDQTVENEHLKDPYFDSELHQEALRRVSSMHERLVDRLSPEIWRQIASCLNPLDAARLTLTSKTLHSKIGTAPLLALNQPGNRRYKTAFLHSLDSDLPGQLLCFPCGRYHSRLQTGQESLKMDYVNHPVFKCPSVKTSVLPRLRLAYGRELPYSFVQLALRSDRHTKAHGIHHEQLARRWKHQESGWSHRTRFLVHDSRLLMRVVSTTPAPPAATLTKTVERHLLYDREEYTPYFSVCAHWRDGELMDVCKCALSHVPSPPESYVQQLKKAPKINRALAHPSFIVRGCDWCRPARRCPECPTEYLVEVQMIEDVKDPVRPFKHAIVVTRWSDLGDGSDPDSNPEWTAVKGHKPADVDEEYESFSHLGRRAVSGIFESRISGSIPGERMLSMNPKNKKLGEEGHGWY